MSSFMDVHEQIDGATPEDIAAAHRLDLTAHGADGVSYLQDWCSPSTGQVFCLSEGPSGEAVDGVRRASYGLAADQVLEVVEGA